MCFDCVYSGSETSTDSLWSANVIGQTGGAGVMTELELYLELLLLFEGIRAAA